MPFVIPRMPPAYWGAMKVLLLNPPAPVPQTREGRCTQMRGFWQTTWPPLSLAMLAAVLRDAGHDPVGMDCAQTATTARTAAERAAAERFDAALWAVGNVTPADDLALAKHLKEAVPGVRTAVFGTFPTALQSPVFARAPELDAILAGEPEASAPALLDMWAAGGSTPPPGVAVRGQHTNAAAAFTQDLDRLPLPAWERIEGGPYRLPLSGRPFLMVATGRGCPHACSFCTTRAYYGTRLRKRAPERIVDELEHNLHEFGVRDFLFWADTFTLDRRHVLDLCEAITRRRLAVQWACNSRIDSVDEAMLAAMRRAGCWMVSFGIESANEQILRNAGKRIGPDRVRPVLEAASREGLVCSGHFILGLPGETRATAEATIAFACGLPVQFAQFYAAAPWPGSRLYAQARGEGRMAPEDAWRGLSQEDARISVCELPAHEVQAFVAAAYRRFYRRPETWLAALRQLRPAGLWPILRQRVA